MHIISVTIQGFKSYRDQTFTSTPFSPAINVIVGRNGSGKSNFFNAVHFVLSDKYSHLRAEERQDLLHEGTGRAVMSAFVEIVFDNSDGRLPSEKSTVSIRRTIGLKKDEYRLDGKTVTQKDVMNFLESAGLSSANPYYIVEQGKVSSLTTMKDRERLDLLKEVAGTKVYDSRRAESLKIMADSEIKIARIDEVIQSIEERLKELEREKRQLKEFEELDKRRKALSYHLYDNLLKEANKQLDDINRSRDDLSKESTALHLNMEEIHQDIKHLEREIKDQELKMNDLKKQKQILEQQREMLVRERTRTELEFNSTKERFQSEERQRASARAELDALKREIERVRRDIEDLQPQLRDARRREQELREILHKDEQRLNQLYSKQGRQTNFASQQERDTWLHQQIDRRTQQISSLTQRISNMEREVLDLTTQIRNLNAQNEEKNAEVENKKREMQEIKDRYARLRSELTALTDQRKEQWRIDTESEEKLKKVREDLNKVEKRLEGTLPRSINRGLQEARRIVREQNIQGVYGTVIELFTTRATYYRACEVTAGNALFHLVVESDAVASEILSIMNRQKAKGRVTFIPLNRITGRTIDIPPDPIHTPLLSKLNFDSKYAAVFSNIFGGTFISPNLETASDFARTNNVNCVTLKGDQINRKGALTGGFTEEKDSRMEYMAQIRGLRDNLNKSTADKRKTKEELDHLDGRINSIVGEMKQLESTMHTLANSISQNNMEISLRASAISRAQESLNRVQRSLETSAEERRHLQEEIETLSSELGTPLTAKLTENERQELDTINRRVDETKKSLNSAESARLELETRLKALISKLNNNLLKRQTELEESYKNLELSRLQPLESAPDQLERATATFNNEINQIDAKIKELEDSIEEIVKEIKGKQDRLDSQKVASQDVARKLEADKNRQEKLLNKKRIFEQRRDTAIAQIRELGAIPQVDLSELDLEDKDQLLSELHKVNDRLKKYTHVNKKALDQYDQFDEQRRDYIAKKKELDQGAKAIQNLIKTLDQKKDEAIERTFKQVSTYFSEIFSELVPGGNARLVMNRAITNGEAAAESTIGTYTGVSINVQFAGDAEPQLVQQLSGGQKSLVALTLIFAIQRCDPAPFYMFDEIDAALDAAYRTSVAQMIHRQAEEKKIQFIITTFKTEIFDYATLFFGITYKNKVSVIRPIDKEEAVRILQEEEQQVPVEYEEREEQMQD